MLYYKGNYFPEEYLWATEELDIAMMRDTTIFAAFLLVKVFYNGAVTYTFDGSNIYTKLSDGLGFQTINMESDTSVARNLHKLHI